MHTTNIACDRVILNSVFYIRSTGHCFSATVSSSLSSSVKQSYPASFRSSKLPDIRYVEQAFCSMPFIYSKSDKNQHQSQCHMVVSHKRSEYPQRQWSQFLTSDLCDQVNSRPDTHNDDSTRNVMATERTVRE